MVKTEYAKAFVEVLECLKLLSGEERSKIPKNILRYFENNRDVNYKFKLNGNQSIGNQELSTKANAINLYLYMNYFATKHIHDKINNQLLANEEKYQQQLRQKYNVDKILKKKETIDKPLTVENINLPIEMKNNFISKLLNMIKHFWHRETKNK